MASPRQPANDGSLPASTQMRSILIFATNWALIYLAHRMPMSVSFRRPC